MGPILVLREKRDTELHEDVTMTDFRNIIDFLVTCGLDTLTLFTRDPPLKHKTKGVKVNYIGDIKRFSKRFVAVDVPKDHPVFLAPPSPISVLVGMPRKYPFDKAWDSMLKSILTPSSNRAAAFLHMVADPNDGMWGFAPMHWQYDTGNMLVVREDRIDISPAEVEMLGDFYQYKMQPLFEDSDAPGGWLLTKREVMACMTPAGFRQYIDEDHESDAINQVRGRDAARDGRALIPLEST